MPANFQGVSPPDSLVSFSLARHAADADHLTRSDVVIVCLPKDAKHQHFKAFGDPAALLKRWRLTTKQGRTLMTSAIAQASTPVFFSWYDPSATVFEKMQAIRALLSRALIDQPRSAAFLTAGLPKKVAAEATTLAVEGIAIQHYPLPNMKSDTSAKQKLRVSVYGAMERQQIKSAERRAAANNRVRWLGALPPNVLDATAYRQHAMASARRLGCSAKFYDTASLEKLGAGAFLAVAAGNAIEDAGIVLLRYRPQAKKRVALVGKGIIFDTGGNNLKPFKSMLDMHMDMLGSAVALASFQALVEAKVSYGIDCWLAITENRLSATAYKSRDVVRAINGKTIETIHTDAEGRMALADTLAMAAKRQPDLIVDFATLTGACVTATTNRMSGTFSNRVAWHDWLVKTGVAAGERVWPFPIGDEFDEDIASDIADLKQCSPDGTGDHILAARFLSHFVPAEIPWLHIDLAASNRAGGLGLASTEVTGFGPRFVVEMLASLDDAVKKAGPA